MSMLTERAQCPPLQSLHALPRSSSWHSSKLSCTHPATQPPVAQRQGELDTSGLHPPCISDGYETYHSAFFSTLPHSHSPLSRPSLHNNGLYSLALSVEYVNLNGFKINCDQE